MYSYRLGMVRGFLIFFVLLPKRTGFLNILDSVAESLTSFLRGKPRTLKWIEGVYSRHKMADLLICPSPHHSRQGYTVAKGCS